MGVASSYWYREEETEKEIANEVSDENFDDITDSVKALIDNNAAKRIFRIPQFYNPTLITGYYNFIIDTRSFTDFQLDYAIETVLDLIPTIQTVNKGEIDGVIYRIVRNKKFSILDIYEIARNIYAGNYKFYSVYLDCYENSVEFFLYNNKSSSFDNNFEYSLYKYCYNLSDDIDLDPQIAVLSKDGETAFDRLKEIFFSSEKCQSHPNYQKYLLMLKLEEEVRKLESEDFFEKEIYGRDIVDGKCEIFDTGVKCLSEIKITDSIVNAMRGYAIENGKICISVNDKTDKRSNFKKKTLVLKIRITNNCNKEKIKMIKNDITLLKSDRLVDLLCKPSNKVNMCKIFDLIMR